MRAVDNVLIKKGVYNTLKGVVTSRSGGTWKARDGPQGKSWALPTGYPPAGQKSNGKKQKGRATSGPGSLPRGSGDPGAALMATVGINRPCFVVFAPQSKKKPPQRRKKL